MSAEKEEMVELLLGQAAVQARRGELTKALAFVMQSVTQLTEIVKEHEDTIQLLKGMK